MDNVPVTHISKEIETNLCEVKLKVAINVENMPCDSNSVAKVKECVDMMYQKAVESIKY